ncbi:hypothetical protein [Mesorhizobium caraganae]|uniref:hypothetical protein n=1 Tax=Mesorhizobium caraganae TaxID=483206 RepID=UPI00333B9A9B
MSAAERMRKTRQRRHKGVIPVSIDIDDVRVPALLVAAGFLASKDADDRKAIGAALESYIAEASSPTAYETVAAQRRALLLGATKEA